MGAYKEVDGDLIAMALNGDFDVICHGVNCFCTMGAGIAPQMAKAFACDTYKMESEVYEGDINKLGTIDWEDLMIREDGKMILAKDSYNLPKLTVVNAYSQYGFGKNHKEGILKPIDYEALTLCMRKINATFTGKHIGLPKIGCGLAGGVWDKYELYTMKDIIDFNRSQIRDVKTIIREELKDCDVTIVIYEP